MSDKKLFEIKSVSQDPEDIVDVGEFIRMHKQLYRIPLMSGGCILVKRLGYLEGTGIQERYKEWYAENGAAVARAAALHSEMKKITAAEELTDEQEERLQEILKELMESPLQDSEPQEMFLDYLQAIIVKPEELKDKENLREFLNSMDEPGPAERIVFTNLIGDFLAQKKT